MIRNFLLSELKKATAGCLVGDDLPISNLSIDSRSLSEGDLFVAIKGERFDGHDYVNSAFDGGCSAALVSEKPEAKAKGALIQVNDTRVALGQIAALNRENFQGKVVGITGSSGKTTVKNMLASILAQKGKTLATKGNYNNEIGVPLTLLQLESSHKFAVVEMGARRVGDIAYLGEFVQPDVAVLLNVGNAHIDVFGSYENIVRAKSEIFKTLNQGGVAVFNADDPAAELWQDMTNKQNAIRFSAKGNAAEVRAEVIEYRQDYSRFDLCIADERIDIALPMPGHHNVLNALAAASAAFALGLSLEQIQEGLESAANDNGRLHAMDLTNGSRLIDDSYNANPASTKAALDVLSLYDNTKIAVLGEMAELGDFSCKLHVQVAEYGANKEIESFMLIGPHANEMARAIGERASVFTSKAELLEELLNKCKGNETILIKGSRVAAMDELVSGIKEAVR